MGNIKREGSIKLMTARNGKLLRSLLKAHPSRGTIERRHRELHKMFQCLPLKPSLYHFIWDVQRTLSRL